MRRKNERMTDDADRVVKDIKRQTRRRFSSEEKIRIVLVRRHGFLDRPQLELSEYLAHLFVDVKRPACGIASAVR